MEKETGKKRHPAIQAIAFLLGLVLLLSVVQYAYKMPDLRIYQMYEGFYEEKDRPLDAVYIGASNVYAFWQPPLAWERFGYTVYTLTCPNMPLESVRYLLEETRKTQPDALYIINLNNTKRKKYTVQNAHYLLDYLPMSAVKLQLIDLFSRELGYDWQDKLELYFPFIRFHTGTEQALEKGLFRQPEHLKNGMHYKTFLYFIYNISRSYYDLDDTVELPEETADALDELIDYCREEQINVLFVAVPQGVTDVESAERINTAIKRVEKAGFPVLNMLGMADEIGLDMAGDFYNAMHTNIHGSSKYIDWFGAYLQEHYDFEDKRGDPAYRDWDEAAAEYHEIIDNYLLDFELDSAPRDYTIPKALVLEQKKEGRVNWLPSSGAEGYAIYRQEMDVDGEPGDWEHIGDVSGDATSYQDDAAAPGARYRYTAAPYVYRDGEKVYGQIDVLGSVKK